MSAAVDKDASAAVEEDDEELASAAVSMGEASAITATAIAIIARDFMVIVGER